MSDRYIPSHEVEVDHVDLMASVVDTYANKIVLQCGDFDTAVFIAKAMSYGVRFRPVLDELDGVLSERSVTRTIRARKIIDRERGNV